MPLYVPIRPAMELVFVLPDANMAVTTDQVFTRVPGQTPCARWRPQLMIAVWKSGAFNTACAGGVYSGAAKSGLNWVAASTSYANLTGSGKMVTSSAGTHVNTDFGTNAPIFSLTTANGAALTADLYYYVQPLDIL